MELAGFRDISEVLGPGVYALVRQGKVVYIGKSRKMMGRIYTHKAQIGKPRSMFTSARGVAFDEVFICPCSIEKLDAVEKDMIELYKPRYNVHLKSPSPIGAMFELQLGDITLVVNRPQPSVIVERRL